MAQVAAFLVLAMAAGVMPLGGQTSLSIYSDGRVVVRRTLPQTLSKGRSTLALKLEGLDPATLFSADTSVTLLDRKSTRLNSSHSQISYAVFCLKKKTNK